MRQTLRLEGFAELEAKLTELPAKLAKRSTTRAMRSAGKLVAEEIRAQAPVQDGALRDSVKITLRNRNLTGLSDYAEAMRAGAGYRAAQSALRGARRSGESEGTRVLVRVSVTAPHAHLVEFGTAERFHESGKSVGMMPANPFIRPAWDGSKDDALVVIRDALSSEIAKLT